MPRTQPIVADGRFVNPGFQRAASHFQGPGPEGSAPGFKEFWAWRKTRPKHPKTWSVPRVADAPTRLPDAPERGVAATWAGHSSVLLQLDGVSYLTDPVWSAAVGGVIRRKTPPGFAWKALPHVDALLLSHNHYDHLDAATIAKLPRDTPVFCPKGVAAWFERRGFIRVTELSWWEGERFGDHRVTFVPAQHFSGRTLWDRDRSLWGGFVVEGHHGAKAYYAGDSGYCSAFKEIGEAFPGIDLALLPIGAYEPRWFMSPVHVDPPEAGQAFLDTGARAMLPVHWGAFRLADEAIDAPPHVLRAWWADRGLAPERLVVPALGERVSLASSPSRSHTERTATTESVRTPGNREAREA